MAADLHAHMRMIKQQCTLRRLSADETAALLAVCPYAFVRQFPRRATPSRGNRGRILSALH